MRELSSSDGYWTVRVGVRGELSVEGVNGSDDADVTVYDPSSG